MSKDIDQIAEEISYYLKQRAYDATTWETSQLDYDEDDYAVWQRLEFLLILHRLALDSYHLLPKT